jgi:hypothetical protein
MTTILDDAKTPVEHQSVTSIPEGQLVKRLLEDPYYRSVCFEPYGFPREALALEEVDLAGAPGGFVGDVDVLLCAPDRPDLAIAIQAKRIKFDAYDIERGSPKKLHGIAKAYEQANRDVRVGFSQVWLYVFVVVDSREQNAGKNSYSGLSAAHLSIIYREVSTMKLNERVGLYQIEFTQPKDHPPLHGMFHGHLRRPAQTAIQTPELTEWVRKKIAEASSR